MAAKLSVKLASSSLNGARLLSSTSGARGPRRAVSTVAGAAPKEVREAIKAKVEEKLPVAVAGLAASSGLAAAPAQAQDVDSAVNTVIDIVKAGGEAAKAGLGVAQTGAEYAQKALEQVAPVVKSAVEVAAPVVTDAVKTAAEVATPVLQSGVKQATKVLSGSLAVDLDPEALSSTTKVAVDTTGQAAEAAKPFLEQAFTFLTTTEPVVLGEYALGLAALYYLSPALLKAAFSALRGYAGQVSPAGALDALSSDGNAVLVDIRTPREKESAGLVDLPNNGKIVELELATIVDRKLRGQLRNVNDLEILVTALQIAALKRLNKSTTIYMLDSRGSTSKAVGRELARRGFGKVFVISGGFAGWQSAKLRTRPSSSVSRVQVLGPGSFSSSRSDTVRSVEVLPPSNGRSVKALPAARS